MRKDLISAEFIDDLKEIKNVIASLATQSQELKAAANKVQEYIEKAEMVDGYERLYEITRELSEGSIYEPIKPSSYVYVTRVENALRMLGFFLKFQSRTVWPAPKNEGSGIIP